jgi:hypothetical protein
MHMKGIIFNLVEDVVCEAHGEQVWDQLLTDAGLEGGYTSLGDYADEELHALIGASSRALDVPAEQVVRTVGHGAALGLAQLYPKFFTPHRRSIDFVVTLNDVIHPEVRKIHRLAEPPEFVFTHVDEAELLVEYRSRRGLCNLAAGMLGGVATYYGELATVTHEQCTHRGDAVCLMRCRFSPAEVEAGPDGD